MTATQTNTATIFNIVCGILADMEREGETSVMTMHGPVSPACARRMVEERYATMARQVRGESQ